MGFLMFSLIITIVIAVAFIAICLAAVKYFSEKKENKSRNDQTDSKTQ